MSILLSDPSTNQASRWSALFNPIIFQYMHTIDYEICAIAWSSGNLTISLPALTNDQLSVLSGKSIYIKTDNVTDNPFYEFTALPVSVANVDIFTQFVFAGIPDNGSSIDGTGKLSVLTALPGLKFRTEIQRHHRRPFA